MRFSVYSLLRTHKRTLFSQIPIKAGHEFTVSVDPKYAEACDDKVIFMDYVS